jgi:hypothetical protein
MNGVDLVGLEIFGEWDIRVEGAESEVPSVEVVQTGEIKRPIAFVA